MLRLPSLEPYRGILLRDHVNGPAWQFIFVVKGGEVEWRTKHEGVAILIIAAAVVVRLK